MHVIFPRPAAVHLRLMPVLVLAGLILLDEPPSVSACEPAPFDATDAAIIAEGWVEAVQFRFDLPSGVPIDPKGFGDTHDRFVPVEVSIRVDRWIRGQATNPLVFIERLGAGRHPDGSLVTWANGDILWGGPANACQAVQSDPIGKYALALFARGADTVQPFERPARIWFFEGPQDPRFPDARQQVLSGLEPPNQIVSLAMVGIPIAISKGGAG